MRTSKWLLWVALAFLGVGLLFVAGWVPVGRAVGAYVTLPVGTVLLGMALIWRLLEGQEEGAAPAEAGPTGNPGEAAPPKKHGGCGCGCGH
ncbi:MAG: hypothetical protein N2438_06030 [Limisphaera sp.]|jgi:hypothetical protein|nr:hypothetical protein [Limisphaera sp.]